MSDTEKPEEVKEEVKEPILTDEEKKKQMIEELRRRDPFIYR